MMGMPLRASMAATAIVPSPPMQTRASISRCRSAATHRSETSFVCTFLPAVTGNANGLAVLQVPRMVPPTVRMLLASS